MSELRELVFTAHQLELEAGQLVKTDNTEDDESGCDGEAKLDHGELAIVS